LINPYHHIFNDGYQYVQKLFWASLLFLADTTGSPERDKLETMDDLRKIIRELQARVEVMEATLPRSLRLSPSLIEPTLPPTSRAMVTIGSSRSLPRFSSKHLLSISPSVCVIIFFCRLIYMFLFLVSVHASI
jgi:hypothetical protein